MNFGEQVTTSGIVLRSDNGKSEGVKPRWGRVFAVGPDQTMVKEGEWILVEHGRWTRSMEVLFEGDNDPIELFRIDPEGIMLSSEDPPSDITFGSYSTPTRPGMSDFTIQ